MTNSNIDERKLKVNTLLTERPEDWVEQFLYSLGLHHKLS